MKAAHTPRTVLMVAYDYPPLNSGGVARTKVFSDQLVALGWQVVVLTPRHPYGKSLRWAEADASGAEVCRTGGLETDDVLRGANRLLSALGFDRGGQGIKGWRLRQWWSALSWPDEQAGWAIPNIVRALGLSISRRVDVVYTTSSPWSDHLVGLALSVLLRKPWIADFRDPYLRNFGYVPAGALKHRLHVWFERQICMHADVVISATGRASSAFADDYPDAPPQRFRTIRNGFDDAEFAGEVPARPGLNFAHTGGFYGTRRPEPFLDALRAARAAHPDLHDRISVTLMGPFPDPDFDLRCRNDYGFVTAIPPQPRAASIELMRSSQVLLLFRHLECTLTLPGKLYEYMASGGHIIAVTGTEDELDVVLADYPNCQILRNPDEGAYRAAIERVFDLYRSGHLVARAPDAVASFSRQRASAVLSEVFDEVLRD